MSQRDLASAQQPEVACFQVRLLRSPFFGEAVAAELASMPVSIQPHEFAELEQLEMSRCQPVLLSWSQHYRLLARWVDLARSHLEPAPLILVRHEAPNHLVPLPPQLLAADVLLSHDPDATAAGLNRFAGPMLVIDDRFRRDGCEDGDNSVRFTLFRGRRTSFAAFVAACGFDDNTVAEVLRPLDLLTH